MSDEHLQSLRRAAELDDDDLAAWIRHRRALRRVRGDALVAEDLWRAVLLHAERYLRYAKLGRRAIEGEHHAANQDCEGAARLHLRAVLRLESEARRRGFVLPWETASPKIREFFPGLIERTRGARLRWLQRQFPRRQEVSGERYVEFITPELARALGVEREQLAAALVDEFIPPHPEPEQPEESDTPPETADALDLAVDRVCAPGRDCGWRLQNGNICRARTRGCVVWTSQPGTFQGWLGGVRVCREHQKLLTDFLSRTLPAGWRWSPRLASDAAAVRALQESRRRRIRRETAGSG